MKVYHSSNMRVKHPDTAHSRRELDFGPGFYFTTMRPQAEKYALRFINRGEPAWLNINVSPLLKLLHYDYERGWKTDSIRHEDSTNHSYL